MIVLYLKVNIVVMSFNEIQKYGIYIIIHNNFNNKLTFVFFAEILWCKKKRLSHFRDSLFL